MLVHIVQDTSKGWVLGVFEDRKEAEYFLGQTKTRWEHGDLFITAMPLERRKETKEEQQ